MDQKKYLRTNEFQDVIVSLQLLSHALEETKTNRAFWKWVILSAHSATQSACVCILTRTDGGGALDENSEKKLLDYHYGAGERHEKECPKTRVANLPDLLRKLPGELKVEIPESNGEKAKGQRNIDFQKLHQIRNQLTHFESVSLSLEIVGLPRIISTAVTLVEQIVVSDQYCRVNKFRDLDVLPAIDEVKLILGEMLDNGKNE